MSCKDSANRAQRERKKQAYYFPFAEVPPIFAKQSSANLGKGKERSKLIAFPLPRFRLIFGLPDSLGRKDSFIEPSPTLLSVFLLALKRAT